MTEEWRPLYGFEDTHIISTFGNVVRVCPAKGVIVPHTHTQYMRTSGYYQVMIRKNGKMHNLFVHRLVAKTFIKNPHDLPVVNHVDGDKTNNKVDNLEWCTYAENTLHTSRKLYSHNKDKTFYVKSPGGSLHVVKNLREFCEENGLHPGSMWNVLNGKQVQYMGYTAFSQET